MNARFIDFSRHRPVRSPNGLHGRSAPPSEGITMRGRAASIGSLVFGVVAVRDSPVSPADPRE